MKNDPFDPYGGCEVVDWRVGLDGQPIKRTPEANPYSHDAYVTWQVPLKGAGPWEQGGIYTDRLFRWGPFQHDRLCRKYFGDVAQWWDTREPKKIEAFLRDRLGRPSLRLTVIVRDVNHSNGFPLWYLGFEYNTEEKLP